MTTLVVLPVKAFDRGKARLSAVLDDAARTGLARSLAEGVVRAVLDVVPASQILVVGDDTSVTSWARGLGVPAVVAPGGLDGAARAGQSGAAADGHDRVLIAHADLLHPESLGAVIERSDPLIVPDRHGRGTNVLAVPAEPPFPFAYGLDSFERHRRAAADLGIDLTVVDDAALGMDVDTPDDLANPATTLRDR